MPKVSVVIPIYNMQKYLKKCLESVANQSERNFEVLMIDDGSTDGSAGIAQMHLTDRRFQYIYQKNAGVSVARNRGIALAKGEWIAFIDSDDTIASNYLESLLEAADDTIDVICCGYQYYKKGKLIRQSFWDGNCLFLDEIDGISDNVCSKKELYRELMDVQYKSSYFRKTAIGVPWGKLYRTSLIKNKNLLFDLRLHRMQDNIFNMYVFEAARIIKYLDLPLYTYNLDHISDYERKYNTRIVENIDLICRIRNDFLLSRNLMEDMEIQKCFCHEILQQSDIMLKKFYLHPENPMTRTQRIKAMKKQFSKDIYMDAMKMDYRDLLNKAPYIRIKFLAAGRYNELILFDHLVQIVRKTVKK